MRERLERGGKVNEMEKGRSPLAIAPGMGRVDCVKLLLEKGAEVDIAGEQGSTPLMVACHNGNLECARVLIEQGADVDRRRRPG